MAYDYNNDDVLFDQLFRECLIRYAEEYEKELNSLSLPSFPEEYSKTLYDRIVHNLKDKGVWDEPE